MENGMEMKNKIQIWEQVNEEASGQICWPWNEKASGSGLSVGPAVSGGSRRDGCSEGA